MPDDVQILLDFDWTMAAKGCCLTWMRAAPAT